MTMIDRLRATAKYHFAPILYRYPPVGLKPAQLSIYIHEILARADAPGGIAEIGCSSGGTACMAASALRSCAPDKTYTCFDTFSGFVKEQIEADLKRGTSQSLRRQFQSNSKRLVRRILNMHGADHVRLVEGDIAAIPDDWIDDGYSVVLCDVDLAEPTYKALKRFYRRLDPDGIILIDDCSADSGQLWLARDGYLQFCSEENLEPKLLVGFGVVGTPKASLPGGR